MLFKYTGFAYRVYAETGHKVTPVRTVLVSAYASSAEQAFLQAEPALEILPPDMMWNIQWEAIEEVDPTL